MDDAQAATLLGALANPTRLAILRHLVRAGPDGIAAGTLAEAVGAAPSRASFHLTALADLGLVSTERQSRSIIYKMNYDRLGSVLNYFIEDCCAGNPVLRASCGVRC